MALRYLKSFGSENHVNSWIAVDNSAELPNICGKSCFLKLLLHLSWTESSKISTLLGGSTFAVFKCELGEIGASLEALDDLLNAVNRFLLWSRNGGTFVSNDWVSWAGMLQKNVGASDRWYEVNHFHLELEGGVWWDDASGATLSIGVLWWARQNGFLSSCELDHAFVPASDDLSDTDLKLERSSFLHGGVENGSVHESTMVMSSNECAYFGSFSSHLICLLYFEAWHFYLFISFYLVKKM